MRVCSVTSAVPLREEARRPGEQDHAAGPETAEKRTIGALRERESGGSCLFLMAEKNVDGRDVRRQLTGKIGFRYGFGRG